MNKDDYAKMKNRQELAKAFIDKLENVNIEDVDIIPALMQYVETGDKTEFKDFCDYHFILSPDEKMAMVENAKIRLDELKEEFERLKEFQKEYTEAYKKLMEWRRTIAETNIEDPSRIGINAGSLQKFLDSDVKELPNWFQKVLYVLDGDNMKRIDHVCVIDKKVIFMMSKDTRLLPKFPDLPRIKFPISEYDVF